MRNERRSSDGQLEWLEVDPARESDWNEATEAGLVPLRRIDQLRIQLPCAEKTAANFMTRAFQVGRDEETFLAVNNRAFAWHPDQSNWSKEKLQSVMSEPWFDANGFLLTEHQQNGEAILAGFCWTKIHLATDNDPEMGEIFVIAVDPQFHGQGLGRQLTLAGLEHIAAQKIDVGMLHVEHDNESARQLYFSLGFVEVDAHIWFGQPSAEKPKATQHG